MGQKNPPRIERSRDELKLMLTEQVELLMLACEAFDKGTNPAAKHIAVSLRVLLHEAGRSRSLLQQLGLRESPMNYAPQCRLVVSFVPAAGSAKYIPNIDPPQPSRKVTFV